MEEKKIKKKKLTLTVSSKKPHNIPFYKLDKQKTSVVIEKKVSRKRNERRFFDHGKNINKSKPSFAGSTKPKTTNNFTSKNISPNRNFEIRKIAEERATKRFRNLKDGDLVSKKSNLG